MSQGVGIAGLGLAAADAFFLGAQQRLYLTPDPIELNKGLPQLRDHPIAKRWSVNKKLHFRRFLRVARRRIARARTSRDVTLPHNQQTAFQQSNARETDFDF